MRRVRHRGGDNHSVKWSRGNRPRGTEPGAVEQGTGASQADARPLVTRRVCPRGASGVGRRVAQGYQRARPRVFRGDSGATCLTHGDPEAGRCEDAPEPPTTRAQDGNAAYDLRGSHSGRSQCRRSRATRSRSAITGGRRIRQPGVSRGVCSGMLSGALRVMQGTTLATQVACGHAPRHTGKPGLGALVPCSSAARQPVPTCATSLRAGRRGAQGTATPFREVATLSPRRRVQGWGAMQFALARSLP